MVFTPTHKTGSSAGVHLHQFRTDYRLTIQGDVSLTACWHCARGGYAWDRSYRTGRAWKSLSKCRNHSCLPGEERVRHEVPCQRIEVGSLLTKRKYKLLICDTMLNKEQLQQIPQIRTSSSNHTVQFKTFLQYMRNIFYTLLLDSDSLISITWHRPCNLFCRSRRWPSG